MRIFFVTSEIPYPPVSGGRVRTLAELTLLTSLEEVTSIDFLTLTEEAPDEKAIAELSARLPKICVMPPVFHPIHLKAHKRWIPFVGAVRMTAGLPYLAAKWISPRVGMTLARGLRRGPFDVIYIDHLGMTAYLPLIRRLAPHARVVMEEHNVESDFFKQFAERKTGVLRAVATLEWRAAARFEANMLRRVDAVAAISETDRQAFAEMGCDSARLVPQVVPFTRTEWSSGKSPSLVYVGNLGWYPNAEGLDWLAEKVWPLVLAKNPKITLRIGGSGLKKGPDGKSIVPEKWKRPGIECIGFVEDLNVFYKDAAAFLAPILSGSGVRIKVLEAFRAGMPLVTTVEGALGLPIKNEREAMVANDAASFADAVVRVCESEELQRRLREGGYAYLEQEHGLAAAQKVMRDVLGLRAKG
jgi:glycosyltransferase involved in cell wall biosynthesis